MATITLELTDDQSTRSMAAFGHWEFIDPPPESGPIQVWVVATPEEAAQGVMNMLQTYVVNYEARIAHQDTQEQGMAEDWGTAIPVP